jgi:hypothetical protein
MDAKQLTEAITDDGIFSPNFFNGRLLSGEDLTREQGANRAARLRLGQAVGAGVAYGLEVATPAGVDTRVTPSVRVEAGMAVNARGETLLLNQPTLLSLVRLPEGSATTGSADPFTDCAPPQAGVYVADAGVYLLVISPASGRAGRAPVSGLGNTSAGCNTRYTVEGVQFRLVQIPMTAQELSAANARMLRNQVAYKCFGYDAVRSFVADPFGATAEKYGAIDDLPASRLGNCDVPLALLHWTTAGGIGFVDLWSVRRALMRREAAGAWAAWVDERRVREGEAMFLQFQEHVSALSMTVGNPQTLVATDYFGYLPFAGVIPIADGAHARGFNHLSFFNGLTYRTPVFIEAAKVETLFREARAHAPIDLKSGELIRLYLVRENRQAVAAGGMGQPTPYMIFASGHLPFRGDARFNLSRWDYSNYSSAAFYGA